MRENRDQNNFEYGHALRSATNGCFLLFYFYPPPPLKTSIRKFTFWIFAGKIGKERIQSNNNFNWYIKPTLYQNKRFLIEHVKTIL